MKPIGSVILVTRVLIDFFIGLHSGRAYTTLVSSPRTTDVTMIQLLIYPPGIRSTYMYGRSSTWNIKVGTTVNFDHYCTV